MSRYDKWKPRSGRKLREVARRSRIEEWALRILKRIPKLFLYGPVAVVLAAIIATDIQWRSFAATAVAVWLIIDLWNWILPKKWKWRFVVGWGGSSGLLIAVMALMYLWMDNKLSSIRNDVNSSLAGRVDYFRGDSPYRSVFVLTNNSGKEIVRKRTRMFPSRMLVLNNSKPPTPGIDVKLPDVSMTLGPDNIEIPNSGGSLSVPFIPDIWHLPLACADVKLTVDYSLLDQPNKAETKNFRFVTRWSPDGLHWLSEPVGLQHDFCADRGFQSSATPPAR